MFKKGRKLLFSSSQKRGVRLRDRNNSADTKVSEEEGGGGAPGAGAEIPLQLMEKTMVRAGCPPAALGGPHARAGSWQDLWTCGERSPHWSRFAGRTCDPCWSSLFLNKSTS